MLYTYNKNTIQFRKWKWKLKSYLIVLIPITIISILIGYFVSSAGNHPNPVEKWVYKGNPPVFLTTSQFSEESLVELLKIRKVKFPHIVLAQARHESNNFTSVIFKENNNLFGMKMAGSRPVFATGTNRNYAMYDNWKYSVYDYIIYQAAYLRNAKTEAQYLNRLSNYASDSSYKANIKRHMKETKLLFKKSK